MPRRANPGHFILLKYVSWPGDTGVFELFFMLAVFFMLCFTGLRLWSQCRCQPAVFPSRVEIGSGSVAMLMSLFTKRRLFIHLSEKNDRKWESKRCNKGPDLWRDKNTEKYIWFGSYHSCSLWISLLWTHTHTHVRLPLNIALSPSVCLNIHPICILVAYFCRGDSLEVRTTTEQNVLIIWCYSQTCQTEAIKRFHTQILLLPEVPCPLNTPCIHIKVSQALPDPVFKPCGCQPSSSRPHCPPLSAGVVWRPGPGWTERADSRRTYQADRHHSGQQDGVHSRILRRQERAHHRSHGLHGESAGGEAAEVLSWGQVPLPAGQT